MTITEFYEITGSNYADVKQRLMRDELITKFVKKFIDDNSYQQLCEGHTLGDIELAYRAVHTLKGVAGTLGFSKLQAAASELTEQLRPHTSPIDEALYKNVCDNYDWIVDNIKRLD